MDEILDVAKNAGIWKAIGKFVDGKVEAGRIIRIAEAEVKRDDIKARARQRTEMDELRHQINMESVLSKTKGQFNKDANPDAVDQDWLANFFDKIRNVSDDEMQILWSQLLAGEINTPRSFSKRTVDLFASLDKEEAEIFATLCSFRCEIPAMGDDKRNYGIFPYIPTNYRKHDIYACISEESLNCLEEAGLVIQKTGLSFVAAGAPANVHSVTANSEAWGRDYILKCHDGEILFRVPADNGVIPLGVVKFTQVGKELSRIVEQKCANGFLDFLKSHYPLSVLLE